MKKTIIFFISLLMIIQVFGEGAMTLSFYASSVSDKPHNTLAAFITDSSGAYVDTFGFYGGDFVNNSEPNKYFYQLLNWGRISGFTGFQDAPADAKMGVTRRGYTEPFGLTWDLKDAAGDIVPDGTYTIHLSGGNYNGYDSYYPFDFVKDANAGTRSVDPYQNFYNISVVYVPAGPASPAPRFTSDPINEIDATEDVEYSSTIADDATDPDGDPMTFSKVDGPAWLSVASDGSLSGTPSTSDIGDNAFEVQVSAVDGTNTAALNIIVLSSTPPSLIANYDFDNYVEDALGENPASTDAGTEDRWYNHNTGALATGVDSLSVITWTALTSNTAQNELDEHDTGGGAGNMVYRAALAAGTITASFDVTLADGCQLTNWDVSFGSDVNRDIDYTITAGSIDGGSGSLVDGSAWVPGGGGTTVGTALTGTFTVQIAFTTTSGDGTSRFDDIQLNGTILGGPAIRIEGVTMLANDVLRLEISGASPAEDYYPESTTNLLDETWERKPHSDDWAHDFIETNLNYSTTLGTNLVIYMQQNTSGVEFIRIKGVDGGASGPVIRIEGMAMLASDVLKLEVSGASPLASYCPASTLDLVEGTWERIPHSDDGVNPFIVTNLTYSATDGTNRFIYMQQSTNRTGFIRIQGVY